LKSPVFLLISTAISKQSDMRKTLIILAAVMAVSGCADPDARLEKRAARIHAAALTVDSHVDTPLRLVRPGFDFMERNDPDELYSRVDLPRMKEGGMDGVFFAVYVDQEERTEEGNRNALNRALVICDSIDALLMRHPDELEPATRSGDLKRISRSGKRAIYLGMENGYPLGNDLGLLDTFYNRGIRYVTLVHVRNNDICDSSNDTLEHGGLSPFGEKVVKRMNDLGIMVDVSHASDDTFRDVMELSRAPVIASHSCAKALCDNPRNLSDDLLLKLKENGGVIQICLYTDYLKTPEPDPQRDSALRAVQEKYGDWGSMTDAQLRDRIRERMAVDREFPENLATVKDLADHIDHVAELIGIDHVGIGTDFDGGAALADCYDVSQMGNITLELVRRGYSAREIKKIWSGNIIRVMRKVESAAL
jgi:membrane dipeptidase